jgi:hypothetical protein
MSAFGMKEKDTGKVEPWPCGADVGLIQVQCTGSASTGTGRALALLAYLVFRSACETKEKKLAAHTILALLAQAVLASTGGA